MPSVPMILTVFGWVQILGSAFLYRGAPPWAIGLALTFTGVATLAEATLKRNAAKQESKNV